MRRRPSKPASSAPSAKFRAATTETQRIAPLPTLAAVLTVSGRLIAKIKQLSAER